VQREEGTTLVTAHNVNILDGALVKITRTTTKVFLSICRFKTSWRRRRGPCEKWCGLWAPVPGNVLVHPNKQALVEWSSSIQHCSCMQRSMQLSAVLTRLGCEWPATMPLRFRWQCSHRGHRPPTALLRGPMALSASCNWLYQALGEVKHMSRVLYRMKNLIM